MMPSPLNRDQLAQYVANEIPNGSYANLGIGLPTKVAQYAGEAQNITFHTENGLLGVGALAEGEDINPNLINAGKIPVTAIPGASYFDHALSFAMIRGGHLDFCILGAYQVSERGDIANWKIPGTGKAPAVGGAMDLVVGAKNIFVMTDLLDRNGHSKVMRECTYPVTGVTCVDRIYTDRAVFEVTDTGLEVLDLFGTTLDELRDLTDLDLRLSDRFRGESEAKESDHGRS